MRTVYRAESVVDAHLVKDALEHADIPAFIAGEHLIGGVGQLPARDFLRVDVPDPCVEAALPVVRQVEARLVQAREAVDDPAWGDDSLPAAT